MRFTMSFSTLAFSFLGACLASPVALVEARGKATGGPASATITIYSGPYTCGGPGMVPPTDGSAGTVVKTFTISETQCQIVNVPLGGAITAKLTAVPKAGAPGCYVQVFQQQGCGVAIGNEYHGFPFDGTIVGSQVGCAQVPAVSYGAVEIICG